MNGRLCHEQRPQSLVSEQGFQFLFAVAFDDEIAIEFRVTDFDILQPQQLADSAEQAAARHAKAEVVGIDVGRPQAGEWYGNLAGVHMKQVERDSPVMVLDFDLVALPCPTFDEVTADFLAELFPDFLDIRAKEPFEERHEIPAFSKTDGRDIFAPWGRPATLVACTSQTWPLLNRKTPEFFRAVGNCIRILEEAMTKPHHKLKKANHGQRPPMRRPARPNARKYAPKRLRVSR